MQRLVDGHKEFAEGWGSRLKNIRTAFPISPALSLIGVECDAEWWRNRRTLSHSVAIPLTGVKRPVSM